MDTRIHHHINALTKNFVTDFLSSDRHNVNVGPCDRDLVLQIISLKTMPQSVPATQGWHGGSGAGVGSSTFSLIVSDGEKYMQALLADQMNFLVLEGRIYKNCLIQVNDFVEIYHAKRAVISDGQNYMQVTCSADVSSLLLSGQISKNSLIRIKDYVFHETTINPKMLVLLSVEPLNVGNPKVELFKIGNPQPLGLDRDSPAPTTTTSTRQSSSTTLNSFKVSDSEVTDHDCVIVSVSEYSAKLRDNRRSGSPELEAMRSVKVEETYDSRQSSRKSTKTTQHIIKENSSTMFSPHNVTYPPSPMSIDPSSGPVEMLKPIDPSSLISIERMELVRKCFDDSRVRHEDLLTDGKLEVLRKLVSGCNGDNVAFSDNYCDVIREALDCFDALKYRVCMADLAGLAWNEAVTGKVHD
ncbi:hypothetical protein HDU76_003453 [Blyttiomyces sp. JEL0837]|nr:hypothetical protein HDU76_003453 [Blyttiomyces sp. JEL0837]